MTATTRPLARVAAGADKPSPVLWRPEDVLITAVPLAAGVVLWAVAWFEASGSSGYSGQIGWADLAVGGFIAATVSQLLWILRGRRTVGELRRQLLQVRVSDHPRRYANAAPRSNVEREAAEIVVAGPNASLFHRPDCAMVAGRGWGVVTRAATVDSGLSPCGVCRP